MARRPRSKTEKASPWLRNLGRAFVRSERGGKKRASTAKASSRNAPSAQAASGTKSWGLDRFLKRSRKSHAPKPSRAAGGVAQVPAGHAKEERSENAILPLPTRSELASRSSQAGEHPSSAFGTSLQTSELVRPSGRLLEAMEGFLLDQRSEHTKRAYSKDLKRFVKYLLVREAERGSEALGRTVLIAYKDSLLGEGLEHTTVDRHLATLRTFFRWLRDEGLIAVNPAEGVRFLKPRRVSSTEGFTDEEVRKILTLPNIHSRTGAQHFAILMVLFHCGLRRGELCSIRTSLLSEERGHRILKLQGKGNRERIVVLVPEVFKAIRHHMRMNGKSFLKDDWLFSPVRNNRTEEREKPLDPSMVFWLVRRYARKAGVVKRVSPHSCRATAISHARDRNVPDRAIQDFAGWASPDMITRYDKRRTAIDRSAALAIDYGAPERELPELGKFTRDSE